MRGTERHVADDDHDVKLARYMHFISGLFLMLTFLLFFADNCDLIHWIVRHQRTILTLYPHSLISCQIYLNMKLLLSYLTSYLLSSVSSSTA